MTCWFLGNVTSGTATGTCWRCLWLWCNYLLTSSVAYWSMYQTTLIWWLLKRLICRTTAAHIIHHSKVIIEIIVVQIQIAKIVQIVTERALDRRPPLGGLIFVGTDGITIVGSPRLLPDDRKVLLP